MSDRLQKELAVYEQHRQQWERDHLNRFVVVYGDDVVGFYDTFELASQDALKRFGPRDVLIRQIGYRPPIDLSAAVLYGLTVSGPKGSADIQNKL